MKNFLITQNLYKRSVLQFSLDKCWFDYAKKLNASVILRGLRVVSDFEYEFQMSSMNKKLNQNIESIFLTPSESYAFLSSSLVKEIAKLGGDVTPFVSNDVKQALMKKFKQ